MLLAGFVFGILTIVRVPVADFTYHRFLHWSCKHTGNDIASSGYVQLLRLVVEVSHQQRCPTFVHLFGQFVKTASRLLFAYPYLAGVCPSRDRILTPAI